MDGGEATPARPVAVHIMELVKFKPAGALGDRGMAFPTAGESSARVLCVDGTVNVTSASDPGGQVGVVTAVATELDLIRLNGGGREEAAAAAASEAGAPVVVARGVSPGELRRVRELCYGDWVVSGPWLGVVVVRVFLNVDVLFDDGSVCRVGPDSALANLVAKAPDYVYLPSLNSPYYPGQRVVAAGHQSSTFEPCQWLNGCWNPSCVEGTVCKVTMAAVLVYWLASAHLGTDRGLVRASAPPPLHRDVGSLTFCPDAEWGVGDHCFFRNPRRPHGRDDQARAEFERSMCVANVRTTVDVLWQDGTRQRGVTRRRWSHSRRSTTTTSSRESVSLPMLAPMATKQATSTAARRASAYVVRSHDCCDHTVRVSWLKPWSSPGPGEEPASCEIECDETVSAYDLRTDCDIFYGCAVVRLPSPPGIISRRRQWRRFCLSKERNKIVCLTVIRWQSVDELYDELNQQRLNWEKAQGKGDQELAATDGGATTTVLIERQRDREGDHDSADGIEGQDDDGGGGGDSAEEVKVAVDAAGAGAGAEDLLRFLQFDVVQSPSDHHYLSDMEQGAAVGRKWTRRVQNGWKILQNNLLETIYVRAFEDRMDLLRAAMVGAAGTPYQDGLFFFDLQLPPSYPAAPPQVCYRSFGLCVNPNLDKSGTVCLSLLGTFDGEDPEVVVSIQGLVLTEQPYYNEAGYEELLGTPAGARNALPAPTPRTPTSSRSGVRAVQTASPSRR
ncbi:putative ubiquitin-conjugating enzyme E2 23 [Panicum miliaceum]|uniref:Ubiquitin-conjugating enzyme E2 23 n=1 Tax=Panicum miliaceum TaxID=4540 RepID=A0A3L6R5V2_PANMI|nr:putative ubiquitin-conjugating enzyme E2 23 [Panicum miliaceum]